MALTRRRRRSASFTTASGTVNRSDTFTRADSAVSLGTPSDGGSAWSSRAGTQGISSNAAYQVAGTQLDSVTSTIVGATSTLTCSANGTAKVDLTRDGGNNGAGGIIFRRTGPGDFFLAIQNGNTVSIYKVVGGSATILQSALSQNYPFTGFSNSIQVVLTATGYTVQTVDSVNGTKTEYGPIADTTGNAAVEHGGVTQDTIVRLDNFSFVGA